MNKLYFIAFIIKFIFINFIYCDDSSRFNDESNEFSIFGSLTYNLTCLHSYHCLGRNEICKLPGLCKCKDHYEYNEIFRECVKCPGLGGICLDNCCANNLQCIKNRCVCVNDIGALHLCNVSKNGVFMTASQIALSAALIMAIAALIMVIYRLCTKPRHLSRNESDPLAISRNSNITTNGNSNTGNSNFLRESLSSMQIRILSRLRDRPPAYDETTNSRQNTNTQRRQQQQQLQQQQQSQEQQNQQQQQQISILPTATTINIPEAPPPYEAEREIIVSQLPPPYSEIIITPSNLTTTPQDGQQNISTPNISEIKSVSAKDEENQKEITVKRNL